MDWSLCFLCRSCLMNGKIRNPQNSNNKQKDSAYVTFEKNLLEFDRIGALPSNITIKNLDEGNGISNTLEKITRYIMLTVQLISAHLDFQGKGR